MLKNIYIPRILLFLLFASFLFALYSSTNGFTNTSDTGSKIILDAGRFTLEADFCSQKNEFYNPQTNLCLSRNSCSELGYRFFEDQHVCG